MAIENFQTYPEVDPNNRVTITPTRVTHAALDRNETAYVASDKGAAFFDGDFVHLLTIYVTSTVNGSYVNYWGLTNTLNSFRVIDNASGDYLGLAILGNGVNTFTITLAECDGGTPYGDSYTTPSIATAYYLKIVRNEAVGTYGTLYCYIYSDAARATLVDTLTLTLHTSKKDFRYVHAVNSDNSTVTPYPGSGYSEDLTISGGGASTLPVVLQYQAPVILTATTATGNAVLYSLGLSAVTAHGHCWKTYATYLVDGLLPLTTDSVVDNGAGTAGAFTSAITGLTAGTAYIVRAYATNTQGAGYSAGLYFIAGATTSIMLPGNIAVKGEYLCYISQGGSRRRLLGDLY